jgi:hypothetical protein
MDDALNSAVRLLTGAHGFPVTACMALSSLTSASNLACALVPNLKLLHHSTVTLVCELFNDPTHKRQAAVD